MGETNITVVAVLLISVTNVFSQAIPRDLPAVMDPTISRIIRKVLRSANEMDDEGVRRLQRGHFFSKTLMPSTIPGQTEKCWNRCEPGQTSTKEQLGLEPPPPPQQERKTTERKLTHRTSNNRGRVEMTISFPKDEQPMLLTALLMPISKT